MDGWAAFSRERRPLSTHPRAQIVNNGRVRSKFQAPSSCT